MADLETSLRALTTAHPRSMQVLLARFGNNPPRSCAQLAAHYGTSEQSAKLLVLYAARDFEAALNHHPSPPPLPDDEAHRAADALEASLDARATDLAAALLDLTTHADGLRHRLTEAERAELASPEYARETWLRRLAIVAVLAGSAWFGRAELLKWVASARQWLDW